MGEDMVAAHKVVVGALVVGMVAAHRVVVGALVVALVVGMAGDRRAVALA